MSSNITLPLATALGQTDAAGDDAHTANMTAVQASSPRVITDHNRLDRTTQAFEPVDTTHISSLPLEVMFHILKEGKSSELARNFGSTCKAFSGLRETMERGPLIVRADEILDFFEALDNRTRVFLALDSLVLENIGGELTGEQLARLPKTLTHITIIGGALRDVSPENLRQFSQLTLGLNNVKANTDFIAAINSSHRKLELLNCRGALNNFQNILRLDNIEELTLVSTLPSAPGRKGLEIGDQLSDLFQKRNLRHLHFSVAGLDSATLGRALSESTIPSLTLGHCETTFVTHWLARNTHIRSLGFFGGSLHPVQLASLTQMNGLQQFTATSMNVSEGCVVKLLTSSSLLQISLKDCNLMDGHLREVHHLTPETLQQSRLQRLDIIGHGKMRLETLKDLAGVMPRLSIFANGLAMLAGQEVRKFFDDVQRHAENYAGLASLEINFEASQMDNLPQLPPSVQTLKLKEGNLQSVDADELESSALTIVSALRTQFSTMAFQSLATRPGMTELTLQECGITDSHLVNLKNNKPQAPYSLSILRLIDNNVTWQATDAIEQLFPELSIYAPHFARLRGQEAIDCFKALTVNLKAHQKLQHLSLHFPSDFALDMDQLMRFPKMPNPVFLSGGKLLNPMNLPLAHIPSHVVYQDTNGAA
ncbi:hypothetical protein [Achromobacter marplatensis]|uniref:hypothetical protein n=1 Tax=Achromobacter marplatensis TaxID=470868 RepID=UPI0039F67258